VDAVSDGVVDTDVDRVGEDVNVVDAVSEDVREGEADSNIEDVRDGVAVLDIDSDGVRDADADLETVEEDDTDVEGMGTKSYESAKTGSPFSSII
jgi:hypothetical protein